MITTFETKTKNITDREKALIPVLIETLQYDVNAPIESNGLCMAVNYRINTKGLSPRMNPMRLRRITNYCRANAIAPIIATEKGYFLARNPSEIETQILSLNERIRSIQDAVRGLEIMLNEKRTNNG
jgi:hypothetical protein